MPIVPLLPASNEIRVRAHLCRAILAGMPSISRLNWLFTTVAAVGGIVARKPNERRELHIAVVRFDLMSRFRPAPCRPHRRLVLLAFHFRQLRVRCATSLLLRCLRAVLNLKITRQQEIH